jgi:hypothetical protein
MTACPICHDLNPACLLVTCEERRVSQKKFLKLRRRPIKNVTPKVLR